MHFQVPALLLVLLTSSIAAQEAPSRQVKGDTLISGADPAARLVINPAFQYAGGLTIDVLNVAGAEQHFFVDAGADKAIRRFYWIQFEHYYPTNNNTYNFSGIEQTPVQLGRLPFMGDIRTRAGYFTMDKRPGSDSKAAADFLRSRGYNLDGNFVTLRMFHLPDDSKRKELMIIYGEVLSDSGAEARVRSEITAHAQANITVP